ncbi:MAG: DoxX family protein [Elusimicrobia bacterium]|nr:DoxX family protein [Elusimicrobiota bacterium]
MLWPVSSLNILIAHGLREKLLAMGLLWLRALAGLGMAHHGYGKVFGGMMGRLTEGVAAMGFPFPELFAWAAALSEFAGGLALALGLGTRIAAVFVFATMSVAVFIAHGSDPLNVKELALAYWAISGALILTGPGYLSLDAWLFGAGKTSAPNPPA